MPSVKEADSVKVLESGRFDDAEAARRVVDRPSPFRSGGGGQHFLQVWVLCLRRGQPGVGSISERRPCR